MSIKDLPHVTVEQVLALRAAAIELEQELETHKHEWIAYKAALENLEASLPKIKADAVLSILEPPSLAVSGDTYKSLIRRHAKIILEAGE